uniref:Uncharacterized protein n=1 Tax=Arundo donax TaxID=35708 RepID=A0A0A9DXE7_ARUDO
MKFENAYKPHRSIYFLFQVLILQHMKTCALRNLGTGLRIGLLLMNLMLLLCLVTMLDLGHRGGVLNHLATVLKEIL